MNLLTAPCTTLQRVRRNKSLIINQSTGSRKLFESKFYTKCKYKVAAVVLLVGKYIGFVIKTIGKITSLFIE